VIPPPTPPPPPIVRAFVAGATGHVGRQVVAALRARGAEVIAHVRPDSGRLDEWRTTFGAQGATVDTTPWDAAALTATLAATKPSHVFCLIGTTKKRASREQVEGDPYMAIDYGLCKILVDAAVASNATPRFVLLSSVGVQRKASSKYLRAHWLAEELVRHCALPWRIARPSMIVGERDEDRPAERAAAAVAGGMLSVVGVVWPRMKARYRPTTAEVLGPAIVRIALDDGEDRVVENEDLR
jgi:nucleoside-diphosphate-sugar epimerase